MRKLRRKVTVDMIINQCDILGAIIIRMTKRLRDHNTQIKFAHLNYEKIKKS